jgi:hypothetical protein
MTDTIVAKAKGFLLDPAETFRKSGNDEPGTVFLYLGVLLLFNATISAIISAVGMDSMQQYAGISWGAAGAVMVFFLVLVIGFTGTLILAAWIHLWVYLLGGRGGILQTVTAIVYGSTPCLILGWIPLLGGIFALWSLVLSVLGIRELHELSTARAILALALPVMIPLIIVLLALAWLIPVSMTVTEVPLPVVNTVQP